MCGRRGLEGDDQLYEVQLTHNFRTYYNKIILPLQTDASAQAQTGECVWVRVWCDSRAPPHPLRSSGCVWGCVWCECVSGVSEVVSGVSVCEWCECVCGVTPRPLRSSGCEWGCVWCECVCGVSECVCGVTSRPLRSSGCEWE